LILDSDSAVDAFGTYETRDETIKGRKDGRMTKRRDAKMEGRDAMEVLKKGPIAFPGVVVVLEMMVALAILKYAHIWTSF